MLSKLWALARDNWKLTFSLSIAFIIGCVLVALLAAWRDGDMVLCSLLGILIGWPAGILLAPYEEEQKKFGKWSKSLAGLLAGLSLGKLDTAFKLASQSTPHSLFRMVSMAFSWLMLSAITVFVVRTYSDSVEPE